MTKERANIAYVMGHQLLQCTIRGEMEKKMENVKKKYMQKGKNGIQCHLSIRLHCIQLRASKSTKLKRTFGYDKT